MRLPGATGRRDRAQGLVRALHAKPLGAVQALAQLVTFEEITELSKRHGGGNVEDLLIWIAKKVDEDGRSVLINPTMVMVDEMFAVGRSAWVQRHIAEKRAGWHDSIEEVTR